MSVQVNKQILDLVGKPDSLKEISRAFYEIADTHVDAVQQGNAAARLYEYGQAFDKKKLSILALACFRAAETVVTGKDKEKITEALKGFAICDAMIKVTKGGFTHEDVQQLLVLNVLREGAYQGRLMGGDFSDHIGGLFRKIMPGLTLA